MERSWPMVNWRWGLATLNNLSQLPTRFSKHVDNRQIFAT